MKIGAAMNHKPSGTSAPHEWPGLPSDDDPQARRERAALRRKAFGSLKGKIDLSLERALAPLDPEELDRWYGD
ncbi:hypothetical protein C3941_01350 [Kaistia algarum]|uniref:hypothetical protein n=1 Tax=Kaistia algarum TaxID=2083279 RepID=UPI000CE8C2ED|nr:hypothetical protein [Kaistia algarum]MCX5513137.1 hypothetical protein [Kaistia algarum]PPE81394.1 hypothetical protein C3941_01350 [Kaistia algarum]